MQHKNFQAIAVMVAIAMFSMACGFFDISPPPAPITPVTVTASAPTITPPTLPPTHVPTSTLTPMPTTVTPTKIIEPPITLAPTDTPTRVPTIAPSPTATETRVVIPPGRPDTIPTTGASLYDTTVEIALAGFILLIIGSTSLLYPRKE